jgi:hypothetical protein
MKNKQTFKRDVRHYNIEQVIFYSNNGCGTIHRSMFFQGLANRRVDLYLVDSCFVSRMMNFVKHIGLIVTKTARMCNAILKL